MKSGENCFQIPKIELRRNALRSLSLRIRIHRRQEVLNFCSVRDFRACLTMHFNVIFFLTSFFINSIHSISCNCCTVA